MAQIWSLSVMDKYGNRSKRTGTIEELCEKVLDLQDGTFVCLNGCGPVFEFAQFRGAGFLRQIGKAGAPMIPFKEIINATT